MQHVDRTRDNEAQVSPEIVDWAIIASLFHVRSGIASVGLKAVALVKPR